MQVNLLGLEFRRADRSTTSLEFSAREVVDLLDLRDGDPLRLFTDEELPVGQYVGVRLLDDENQDDSVVQTSDREFPLLLADGAFATVDFSVDEEERSREALTLMLDLRQALALDDSDEEYTLTPQLRAVRTEDTARIEGAVTATCPAGTALSTGPLASSEFAGQAVGVVEVQALQGRRARDRGHVFAADREPRVAGHLEVTREDPVSQPAHDDVVAAVVVGHCR